MKTTNEQCTHDAAIDGADPRIPRDGAAAFAAIEMIIGKAGNCAESDADKCFLDIWCDCHDCKTKKSNKEEW